MSAIPKRPPQLLCYGAGHRVRAAAPVYGTNGWRDVARVAAWLQGRGLTLGTPTPFSGVILSNNFPINGIAVAGGVSYFTYVSPNPTTKGYLWLLTLAHDGEPGSVASGLVRDPITADQLASYTIDASRQNRTVTVRAYMPVSSPADGLKGVQVTNDSTSTSAVYVVGMNVVELPRGSIDAAVKDAACASGEPLYADGSQGHGLDQLAAEVGNVEAVARRAMLVGYILPTAFHTTSTGFVQPNFSSSGSWQPCQARCLRANTTRTINWAAYVQATGGNGEIRVITSPGFGTPTDTDTQTITASSYAIMTGTVDIRTEDPTTWDSEQGLRDSTAEYITCEVRRTTGSSVDLQGFWAWEAD